VTPARLAWVQVSRLRSPAWSTRPRVEPDQESLPRSNDLEPLAPTSKSSLRAIESRVIRRCSADENEPRTPFAGVTFAKSASSAPTPGTSARREAATLEVHRARVRKSGPPESTSGLKQLSVCVRRWSIRFRLKRTRSELPAHHELALASPIMPRCARPDPSASSLARGIIRPGSCKRFGHRVRVMQAFGACICARPAT
jgi:hypothetical protein